MRRKRNIMLACLVAMMTMLLFTGCEVKKIDPEDASVVSVTPKAGNHGFQIEDTPNGMGSCIAGNQNYSYYTRCTMIPMSNAALRAEVWQYDFATEEAQLLYVYEDEEGFWINELKATEENVYWVFMKGEYSAIQAFSLKEQEVRTIYEKKEYNGFSLTAGDGKLVWYDETGDEEEAEIELCIYDEKEDCITRLRDGIIRVSPYDRIYIEDGICSYLRIRGTNKELVRYDLEAGSEVGFIAVNKAEMIESIQANGEYYIWVDEAYGSGEEGNLCIYHCDDGLMERIEVPDLECKIFSINLMRDQVIVNFSETGLEPQGDGGIYIYDIERRELWKPEYDRSAGNVVVPTVINGGYFLAENGHYVNGEIQDDTLLILRFAGLP